MYKRFYKSPCHGPISQKMMSYYRWPGVWQQLHRNFHHNSLQALDWVQRKTKHCNTELAAYHSRPQFWRQCTHKSTHFSFVWCLTTIFNLTSTDEKFFFYFPKLAGFTKRLTAIYWFLLYSLRFWFFFLLLLLLSGSTESMSMCHICQLEYNDFIIWHSTKQEKSKTNLRPNHCVCVSVHAKHWWIRRFIYDAEVEVIGAYWICNKFSVCCAAM